MASPPKAGIVAIRTRIGQIFTVGYVRGGLSSLEPFTPMRQFQAALKVRFEEPA
jgi:hypothetical protein